jgi:hypothetical protein
MFTEWLYHEVSAITQLSIILTLTSGQDVHFINICVIHSQFASELAIEEMEVHSFHLPQGVSCQTTSLLAHGSFVPVSRKETLSVIEQSEQGLYKYEPALQVGTESTPRFKICTHQVFTTACAPYQNFSELQMVALHYYNGTQTIPQVPMIAVDIH